MTLAKKNDVRESIEVTIDDFDIAKVQDDSYLLVTKKEYAMRVNPDGSPRYMTKYCTTYMADKRMFTPTVSLPIWYKWEDCSVWENYEGSQNFKYKMEGKISPIILYKTGK